MIRYYSTVVLVLFSVATQGQLLTDSILCLDNPNRYIDFYGSLEGAHTPAEAWEWWSKSLETPSSVIQKEWKWIELGPKQTPSEAQPSRALPEYSLGRGNGTGRVNALYINPSSENQVFACSPTGGLFYSEDYGESWKNGGTDHLPVSGVSSVTVNPRNENNWIVATGDGDDLFMFSSGLYRTFNKGKTWEEFNGKFGFQLPSGESFFDFYVSELVSHPKRFKCQYLASNLGFFTTTNANRKAKNLRWTKVTNERIYDIEISPVNSKIVAAAGDNLWISRSRGNYWTKFIPPILKNSENYGLVRLSLEFSSENENIIYAVITRKKGLGAGGIGSAFLYEFNLKTKEWKLINELRKNGNVIPTRARAFEKNPSNDSIMLIGNVKPVRISKDYGSTFTKLKNNQMHDDIHDFEFFSDGITVLASHDGGVSKSRDGGYTWTLSDNGISVANVHGLDVAQTEETKLLYGAYDTGSYKYEKGEWLHVAFGDGFEPLINSSDPDQMMVTMQNGGIFISDSTGTTFNEKARMKGIKSDWHTWIKANPELDNTIYHSGIKLARSMNFGKDWEIIMDPVQYFEESVTAWRFFQTDGFPDKMFVVVLGKTRKDDAVFMSSNVNEPDPEKVQWFKIPELAKEGWVASILHDPSCETCHTISYNAWENTKKVFYFDGISYSDITFDLGYAAVRSGVRDKINGRIYLGTRQGVFTKSSEESQWTLLKGLPSARIWGMEINYVQSELYLGLFGRGIWSGTLMKE
ncbi:MAG: WD40/YVTN/BNR-like repeat-containing protein [Flavobacteriales bacterium]